MFGNVFYKQTRSSTANAYVNYHSIYNWENGSYSLKKRWIDSNETRVYISKDALYYPIIKEGAIQLLDENFNSVASLVLPNKHYISVSCSKNCIVIWGTYYSAADQAYPKAFIYENQQFVEIAVPGTNILGYHMLWVGDYICLFSSPTTARVRIHLFENNTLTEVVVSAQPNNQPLYSATDGAQFLVSYGSNPGVSLYKNEDGVFVHYPTTGFSNSRPIFYLKNNFYIQNTAATNQGFILDRLKLDPVEYANPRLTTASAYSGGNINIRDNVLAISRFGLDNTIYYEKVDGIWEYKGRHSTRTVMRLNHDTSIMAAISDRYLNSYRRVPPDYVFTYTATVWLHTYSGSVTDAAWLTNTHLLVAFRYSPFARIYATTADSFVSHHNLPNAVSDVVGVAQNPVTTHFATAQTPSSVGVRLYRFDNGVTTSLQVISNLGSGDKLAWSPNGEYLAVGAHTAPTSVVAVYRLVNDSLVFVDSLPIFKGAFNSLTWKNNSEFIVLTQGYLAIHKFTITSTTLSLLIDSFPADYQASCAGPSKCVFILTSNKLFKIKLLDSGIEPLATYSISITGDRLYYNKSLNAVLIIATTDCTILYLDTLHTELISVNSVQRAVFFGRHLILLTGLLTTDDYMRKLHFYFEQGRFNLLDSEVNKIAFLDLEVCTEKSAQFVSTSHLIPLSFTFTKYEPNIVDLVGSGSALALSEGTTNIVNMQSDKILTKSGHLALTCFSGQALQLTDQENFIRVRPDNE